MTATDLQLIVHSGLLAAALASAAHADDASPVSKQEIQAKLAYCEQCHGSSARGFRGYYPMPRLAGQQPEYLKNQLQAFAEHRRKNSIMFNVSRALSPTMTATPWQATQAVAPLLHLSAPSGALDHDGAWVRRDFGDRDGTTACVARFGTK